MVVHTLGHSTLALEDFLALLAAHAIDAIADVRRFPASRRHPHFAREPLAASLAARGVVYSWLPALGGRRAPRPDSLHAAWRNASFRAYADHMDGPEFEEGLAALLELARDRRAAIMCAEAVPWRCHRSLVADALIVRGIAAEEIVSVTRTTPHQLTSFAKVSGTRVTYPPEGLPL